MSAADSKIDQVVSAALDVFGRYGYRRTSMELIAKAAGISRPALYQHFSGKEDIFRAAGERIADELVSAAETAAAADGPSADRLYHALAVKLDSSAGLADSRFRRDLIAEASARLPGLQASMKARHGAVIEQILNSAADLDVAASAISAHDIAVVLLDALTGIAQQDEPAEELQRRLRQLVSLTIGSLDHPAQFVKGITKEQFPTPFSPAPLPNLIGGWAMYVLAALLLLWAHVAQHPLAALITGALGVLPMGIFHARIGAFGKRPSDAG